MCTTAFKQSCWNKNKAKHQAKEARRRAWAKSDHSNTGVYTAQELCMVLPAQHL